MSRSKVQAPEQWVKWYLEHLKQAHKAPYWVYQLTGAIGKDDADFYQSFQDIGDLEQYIWECFFKDTLDILLKDHDYPQYTAREKLLSFYFTSLEILAVHRNACILMFERGLLPVTTAGFLKKFRQLYLDYVEKIILESIQEGSILDRIPFTEYYKHLLWLQCYFVLQYWVRDRSDDFVNTDAAIEKAVNLSFDLLGQNALDSLVGMGKFLYQTWRS